MRARSIAEKIFSEILEIFDGALSQPNFSIVQLNGGKYRHDRMRNEELRKRRRALQMLQRQGVITLSGRADETLIRITAVGKHVALQRLIVKKKTTLAKGLYCYVIFDIPEDRRRARKAFSRLLQDAKFERVQKSIWRTRRDVAKEITQLIKIHRAQKYIRVIVGKEIV